MALDLAAQGSGRVAPNPMVGAILVKEGVMIGQGYHQAFGGPHAEVNALADCRAGGHDPAGATLFVTLEPCCHHGKTPPCTNALLAAGIRKVEITTLDDFKEVAGKGADLLRQWGLEVVVGCCEREARRLNAGFFKLQRYGQPQVILKWAQSADGKLAWPAQSGQRWITGETARHHVHQVRSGCGAVLAGIGTVLADDPLLNVRLPGGPPQPVRVILDSQLRIPLDSQLVKTAAEFPLLVFASPATLLEQREKVWKLINAKAEVTGLKSTSGGLDLPDLLHQLGQRGICDLLIEGGPTVINSFLQQHLADKALIYTAPITIGPEGLPSPWPDITPTLQGTTQTTLGDDLLYEGYFNTPPDGLLSRE